jgi:uncharacterized membrane protein YphA (DoxX/SURF4 family)
MRIAALIARYLLAVMFLVFGFNGFFHFIPMPMPTGVAGQFMGALFASHMYIVTFAVQIVSGFLFLIGRYVPLALVLIGPVLVNILSYHLFLDPSGIGPGLFATILWLLVFSSVRGNFTGVFAAKA